MLRAVAYSSLQNFESAIDDLTTYLSMDSLSVLALWQRAVCQSKLNDFHASQTSVPAQETSVSSTNNIDLKVSGTGTLAEALQTNNVLTDLSKAISLSPHNAYLLYNKGNVYVSRKDYAAAIDDYSRAIALDSRLAEAYYNRGLAYIDSGKTEEGIRDLSKAGELGLYTAYSLIKRFAKE